METIIQDIRYAVRVLARSRSFTIASLLTLALGIGATTAIFSVLYCVVIDPLPFHDPSRLMVLWETDPHNNSFHEGASYPDLRDWQAQTHSFEQISGSGSGTVTLTDPSRDAERVASGLVLEGVFETLGVRPQMGRSFTASDDVKNAAPVTIISDRLWHQRYGGGSILDRNVMVDGKPYRVIGVMPAAFSFPARTEIWLPFVASSGEFGTLRGVHNLIAIGRLRADTTVSSAQAEMTLIMKRLAAHETDTAGRGSRIEPMHEAVVGDVRPRLLMLTAAVSIVLLIGCINVAGLMLARATSRSKELAIRASLGASRGRVARQLFVESLVLSLAGAILGVGLAAVATRALVAMLPSLPRASGIGMRAPVLAFAILTAIASAVVFGLVPAFRASAAGAFSDLRGRSHDPRRSMGRSILVVAELALAVILVVGAGLFLESLKRLTAIDPGVKMDHVLTAAIELPASSYPVPARKDYPNWPRATVFYTDLLTRLRGIHGVRDAALALNHPFASGWTTEFSVEGLPDQPEGSRDEMRVRSVTSGYFEALGIPLLRGRTIKESDRAGGAEVALINEAFARRYFANTDPIGKHVSFWGHSKQIIGVVRGERFRGLERQSDAAIYPALSQVPMSSLTIVLRVDGDPMGYAGAVRNAVHAIDRGIAVDHIEPVGALLSQSTATPQFQTALITLFGLVALVLAAIGLYGLIAYQVQQRTHEIGIRLALGAQQGQVLTLVIKRGLALALAGIAIGLVCALGATRFIAASLFQVSTTDPKVFGLVSVTLALIALAASYIPARAAARVDPATALRYE